MSRICELCSKRAVRANHRSHSEQIVPRRQKPNLQSLTVSGISMKICSSCRRTLSKKKA